MNAKKLKKVVKKVAKAAAAALPSILKTSIPKPTGPTKKFPKIP